MGTTLSAVAYRHGPSTVALLHGWPQTGYAWRRVAGLLRSPCRALAYDLPGIGASARHSGDDLVPADKWSIAGALHADLSARGVHRPVLVGHDVGASVAYAYARRYPAEAGGVLILDYPLPGIPGWADALFSPALWHVGLHQAAGQLAETLVDGRQEAYFRAHLNRFAARPDAFTELDVQIYADGYRTPGQLAAGFAWFRAFPVDVADNRAHAGPLDVPVHLAYAEFSYGTLLDEVAAGLREAGADRVSTALIPGCGHWPAEEQPRAVAQVIDDFVVSCG